MDYDFQSISETLRIPTQAYLPVKRCPYCQSVFINKQSCESCGRSMLYHPIGEPFGPKSFYGMKESYVENLNFMVRFFPPFENKKSPSAQGYLRKLKKRFFYLLNAFNTPDLIAKKQRQIFYNESKVLIDELLCYGISAEVIQALIEESGNSLLSQDLHYHLQSSMRTVSADMSRIDNFLNYRLWGLVRVEYSLKVVIVIVFTIILLANYKEIISSQFGK